MFCLHQEASGDSSAIHDVIERDVSDSWRRAVAGIVDQGDPRAGGLI